MALDSVSSIGNTGATYKTTDVSPQAPSVEATAQTQAVSPKTVATNNNFDSQSQNDDNSKGSGNAPSENTIKQAISDINKKINPNTIAEYGYHEETNRVTIKIVDKDSDKVVKEFPAEETLDMIAKVWELAGMFLDEKG